MSQLNFYLLGPPRLEHEGKPIEISLRKALALLVYLAITGCEHSRDELATLFWSESSQRSSRANLRRTLYVINKHIGGNILQAGKEHIRINPEASVWIDSEAFRNLIREAGVDRDPQGRLDSVQITLLAKADAMYQGDFLAGFTLPDCPGFDEWQFFETESLRSMLSSTLRQLTAAYQSLGDGGEAIEYARRWLSIDPLHEPAHRLLMRLFEASGQHAASLRQYHECERILNQELGVSPQEKTRALFDNIRLHREIEAAAPARVLPEVKYVASGDVHIAYIEWGEGPIDLIWVCGYISHVEQIFALPEVYDFFKAQTAFSRLIFFDRRGVGLSERIGYPPTLEDTLLDIQAVIEATGAKRPVLLGYLEGGPTSILYTATYPEQVSGLILYGTRAKWTRSEDYPWTITREQYGLWLENICENWGEPLDLEIYSPSMANETYVQEWWAKLMRLASSPGGMKAVLEVMRDIDVRGVLPTIRTPTLILQRKRDRAFRIGAGRHLASQIPGATYVELEGDDHWPFMGDTHALLTEMENFIKYLKAPAIPEGVLATILLVNGMDRSQDDKTYAILHQEIKRFRGQDVGWDGGCCSATFDGPTRAIHCALEIMGVARQHDVLIKAALHTGECIFKDAGLAGPAFEIARVLLKSAGAGEILVSRTVKDLVVGSGFMFHERGEQEFEGVSGTWKVFSVH